MAAHPAMEGGALLDQVEVGSEWVVVEAEEENWEAEAMVAALKVVAGGTGMVGAAAGAVAEANARRTIRR